MYPTQTFQCAECREEFEGSDAQAIIDARAVHMGENHASKWNSTPRIVEDRIINAIHELFNPAA